ncbi:MAG: type II toxin-antitoxin system VapC family toxin [Nitrospirae bacterium]|nr:type II toxin-antitoxin system VapC family toxin [Nitrospirota bacterium]
MIIAVDTNILLDILIQDEHYFKTSKRLLDEYIQKGQLIICEIVYAELASQFQSEKDLKEFLKDTGIRLVHSTQEAFYEAGRRWKKYTKNKRESFQCPKCGQLIKVSCKKCHSRINPRQHMISDFIIGAHALQHAGVLLSRDRGYYKTYFKDLKVVQSVASK